MNDNLYFVVLDEIVQAEKGLAIRITVFQVECGGFAGLKINKLRRICSWKG